MIPLTVTTTVLADAGADVNVNEVVVPSPVNELTVGFRSELDNCHDWIVLAAIALVVTVLAPGAIPDWTYCRYTT